MKSGTLKPDEAVARVLRGAAKDPDARYELPAVTLEGYEAELFEAICVCLKTSKEELLKGAVKQGLSQYRTGLTAMAAMEVIKQPHLRQMALLHQAAKGRLQERQAQAQTGKKLLTLSERKSESGPSEKENPRPSENQTSPSLDQSQDQNPSERKEQE